VNPRTFLPPTVNEQVEPGGRTTRGELKGFNGKVGGGGRSRKSEEERNATGEAFFGNLDARQTRREKPY